MTSAAPSAPCAVPPGADAARDQMADLVNALREGEGLTELTRSRALERAAQTHACDMAESGVGGAWGADGSRPLERARLAGAPACAVSQLELIGPEHAGAVLLAWWDSPPARALLTAPRATMFGLGLAMVGDSPVWVGLTGRGCTR